MLVARLSIARQLTCGSRLAHLTEKVVVIWLHILMGWREWKVMKISPDLRIDGI